MRFFNELVNYDLKSNITLKTRLYQKYILEIESYLGISQYHQNLFYNSNEEDTFYNDMQRYIVYQDLLLLNDILDKKFNDQSGLIYGIGHAVYTLSDPRCQILSKQCKQLAIEKDRLKEYDLYHRFEEIAVAEIEKRKGIHVCANIDFYSGLVYDMLGIPKDLYTLMFVIGRSVGWVAHNIENKLYSGRIIRPAGKYVGEKKEYIKMENR